MTPAYCYYLVLLSCISFGGHFARSAVSMFGLYLINDKFITPAGLGLLLGACSLPSMFIPLLVGHSIDKTKKEMVITLLLFLFEISGLTVFSIAIYTGSFTLAISALLLFGIGASSITVIQRILVTLFLKENISFTTGFYIALANIAKLLGKITIGPTSIAMQSYKQAMLLPILACIVSLLCYLLFHSHQDHGMIYISIKDSHSVSGSEVELTLKKGKPEDQYDDYEAAMIKRYNSCDDAHQKKGDTDTSSRTIAEIYQNYSSDSEGEGEGEQYTSPEPVISQEPKSTYNEIGSLPPTFYALAGVHTLYVLIFHALVNFLPHFVFSEWGGTAVSAGLMSSIPYAVIILVAPCVGVVVDRTGQRVPLCTAAAAFTVVAYSVLLFSRLNPYYKMVLISLPQGLIPLLTLAEISTTLPPQSVGIAFGIIEVLDSLVNVFGNILFGWLYNVTGSYLVGMVALLVLAWVGLLLLVFLVIIDSNRDERHETDNQDKYDDYADRN